MFGKRCLMCLWNYVYIVRYDKNILKIMLLKVFLFFNDKLNFLEIVFKCVKNLIMKVVILRFCFVVWLFIFDVIWRDKICMVFGV